MKVAKTIAICAGLWLLTSCGKQDASSAKAAPPEQSPKVQVTNVVAQKLSITVHLPGEIEPYEVVAIFPKVTVFVKSITVYRGSRVKTGERIAQLEAPELIAQSSEAQSKFQAAQAQLAAAEAKVASDEVHTSISKPLQRLPVWLQVTIYSWHKSPWTQTMRS